MAEKGFLRWIDGAGWLVFSGGVAPGSPIRAQALARADADGNVVYLSLADDTGDALLHDMEDLGAPAGYLVDILNEDANTIYEQIKDASVIVLEIGDSLDALYRAMSEATVKGIREAYEHGAVVLIEALAVNLFGHWVVSDAGQLLQGLGWVQHAIIEPDARGFADSRAVQAVLSTQPDAVAVSIAAGSALALGGGNQVELWGAQQVTISLGSQYSDSVNN